MQVKAHPQSRQLHTWSLPFLLCALVLQAFTFSAGATPEMKRNFLMKSKLKEGPVTLLKGPSTCQEGDISVTDLGDELFLNLGAHPLAMSLGKNEDSYDEENCRYNETSSIKLGEVIWTQHQVCKLANGRDEVVDRKVVVTANRNGFKYVRTNTAKGNAKTITCEYKFSK